LGRESHDDSYRAEQDAGPNDEEREQPQVPMRAAHGALLVIGQLCVDMLKKV
jgi:hypothetical protein